MNIDEWKKCSEVNGNIFIACIAIQYSIESRVDATIYQVCDVCIPNDLWKNVRWYGEL
jgi:hypothetical protein